MLCFCFKNLSFYNELYTVRLGAILGTFWHREGSMPEPSRAEPGRAGPGRAEPSRAEPSRAEPSRAGPGRAEPSMAEGRAGLIFQNLFAHRTWDVFVFVQKNHNNAYRSLPYAGDCWEPSSNLPVLMGV